MTIRSRFLLLIIFLIVACSQSDTESSEKQATTANTDTAKTTIAVKREDSLPQEKAIPEKPRISLESDEELCQQMGSNCGMHIVIDSCGKKREVMCGTPSEDEACLDGRKISKKQTSFIHTAEDLRVALLNKEEYTVEYLLRQNISLTGEAVHNSDLLPMLVEYLSPDSLKMLLEEKRMVLAQKDIAILEKVWDRYCDSDDPHERETLFKKMELIVPEMAPLHTLTGIKHNGTKSGFSDAFFNERIYLSDAENSEKLAALKLFFKHGMTLHNPQNGKPYISALNRLLRCHWDKEYSDSLMQFIPDLSPHLLDGEDQSIFDNLVFVRNEYLLRKIHEKYRLNFNAKHYPTGPTFLDFIGVSGTPEIMHFLIEEGARASDTIPLKEELSRDFKKHNSFSQNNPELFYSIIIGDTITMAKELQKTEDKTLKKELLDFAIKKKRNALYKLLIKDTTIHTHSLEEQWFTAWKKENEPILHILKDTLEKTLSQEERNKLVRKAFSNINGTHLPFINRGVLPKHDTNTVRFSRLIESSSYNEKHVKMALAMPQYIGRGRNDSVSFFESIFYSIFDGDTQDIKRDFAYLIEAASKEVIQSNPYALPAACYCGSATEVQKILEKGGDPEGFTDYRYYQLKGVGISLIRGKDYKEKVDAILDKKSNIPLYMSELARFSIPSNTDVMYYLINDKKVFDTLTEKVATLSKIYRPVLHYGTDSLFTLLSQFAPQELGIRSYDAMFIDACSQGYVQSALHLLKEKKASIHCVNRFGESGLYAASLWGRTTVVKELLNRGADFTQKTKSGRTPYMAAYAGYHPTIMKLLEKAGASSEKTPLFEKGYFLPAHYDTVSGFVTKEGKEILFDSTYYAEFHSFDEGYVKLRYTNDTASGKYGSTIVYMNSRGETPIIKENPDRYYTTHGCFEDNLAAYSKDSTLNIFDKTGKNIFSKKGYRLNNYVPMLSQGHLLLEQYKRDAPGLLCTKNGEPIPLKRPYLFYSSFSNNWAIAQKDNSSYYHFVSIRGETINTWSKTKPTPFQEGLTAIKRSSGYKIMNRNGKCSESSYTTSRPSSEGLMAVQIHRKNQHYSYVTDKNGKEVRKFYPTGYFWGFIDSTLKTVISHQYREVESFSEGMAAVLHHEKERWGFINKAGKTVIDFKYRHASSFSNGLAAVSIDGEKWGYINSSGEMVIDAHFDYADPFDHQGIARVLVLGEQDGYYEGESYFPAFMALLRKDGSYIYKENEELFTFE